jgi:hypothetical protein
MTYGMAVPTLNARPARWVIPTGRGHFRVA